MEPHDISRIAHNDAYFGLGGAMDTTSRAEYMSQDVLMRESETAVFEEDGVAASPIPSGRPHKEAGGQRNEMDGHEYLEHPTGSGVWYYRNRSVDEWIEWKQ